MISLWQSFCELYRVIASTLFPIILVALFVFSYHDSKEISRLRNCLLDTVLKDSEEKFKYGEQQYKYGQRSGYEKGVKNTLNTAAEQNHGIWVLNPINGEVIFQWYTVRFNPCPFPMHKEEEIPPALNVPLGVDNVR